MMSNDGLIIENMDLSHIHLAVHIINLDLSNNNRNVKAKWKFIEDEKFWLEIKFEQVGILTFNVFVKVRKNQK